MSSGNVDAVPDHAAFDERITALEQQIYSDPPAVIETGGELIREIDARGTMGQRLSVRRLLAMAHAHASHFEAALRICEEAMALPGASDAPIDLARVTLASTQALANLDRIDEAIQHAERALGMLEEQGATIPAGRAALNIGSIYAMTGRPAEALPWFDRAADLLHDDPISRGQVETNRGTALAALDRFEEAEVAFRRASGELLDEMAWALAIAEGNLADLAARQGEINRSLQHFENSRRHLERDEAWADLGRLNAEEATVLAMMGLTGVARDAFTGAIDMLRQGGTRADLAMAEIAYGTALADASELQEAETVLAETGSLVDPDEQPSLYLQLLSLRARVAMTKGNLDEARASVIEARNLIADRPVQHLRWTMMDARITRLEGNANEAERILRTALDGAAAARVSPLVADITTSLAELARERGDDDAADTYAREAIAATEGVRGTIQADRIRQSWHRDRLGVYGGLYRSALSHPDAARQAEAFDVAERIRSRTLLDAVHLRGDDIEDTEPITDAERDLVNERARHRRWLNWMYSSLAEGNEPTDAQLDELRERERMAAQLDDRIETLRPASPLGTPLTLDAVQEMLPEDHGILAYLRVGDTYSLQVITHDSASGIPDLAPAQDVGALVAQLQFQLNRALAHGDRTISPSREARLRRDADGALQRLHAMLIAPVAERITSLRRVIVIPSSDLYSVPFAALREDDGRYLVDRHEIVTAPGASILARLRPPLTRPVHPLVAGVPDSAAPGLGEEAQFVARRFPGATTLLADEATRDAVLSAIPDADLIHLACHGRFDSIHPTASGLRLADGWLTVDRLMETRLDDPMVVLTGCETGRVRVDRGDDLVGLIVALIASGASALVTSLWKTHDAAATAAMDTYYDALMSGLDPVSALRRSQLDVRSSMPHPAFWAPFIGVHASPKGASA